MAESAKRQEKSNEIVVDKKSLNAVRLVTAVCHRGTSQTPNYPIGSIVSMCYSTENLCQMIQLQN
jgi:hypothetical protein